MPNKMISDATDGLMAEAEVYALNGPTLEGFFRGCLMRAYREGFLAGLKIAEAVEWEYQQQAVKTAEENSETMLNATLTGVAIGQQSEKFTGISAVIHSLNTAIAHLYLPPRPVNGERDSLASNDMNANSAAFHIREAMDNLNMYLADLEAKSIEGK